MFKKIGEYFKKEIQLTIDYYRSPKEIASEEDETDEATLEERNAQYLAMREKEEDRLNNAYDFNSINGINAIPVPCKEVNGDSSTGRVEYYLRGACFANHWNAGRIDLALACLKKAQALMCVSNMIWDKKEFMRLVYYLRKAGRNEQADEEERLINEFFQNQNIVRDMMINRLSSAKYIDTDLMEVTTSGVCCAECAKYRSRIYSISGADKRFPALPKMFLPDTFDYNHVCLSFCPFIEGVMEPHFPAKNTRQLIKYSNRPFVDDRTPEEIERYINWKKMIEKQEKEDKEREIRRQEFAWIQENLPALCPKSLSGYSRMKNANSASYQKIAVAAERLGKNLT